LRDYRIAATASALRAFGFDDEADISPPVRFAQRTTPMSTFDKRFTKCSYGAVSERGADAGRCFFDAATTPRTFCRVSLSSTKQDEFQQAEQPER